ncbi:uncharacterized protein LOC143149708 [Ptiloglossa arizonensis]|uniref:uncharacterized protein LOC143149708 n=1 Tax=Ptiloglossa arizonensis TaxID=3350558 RepID=UPI003F9F5677
MRAAARAVRSARDRAERAAAETAAPLAQCPQDARQRGLDDDHRPRRAAPRLVSSRLVLPRLASSRLRSLVSCQPSVRHAFDTYRAVTRRATPWRAVFFSPLCFTFATLFPVSSPPCFRFLLLSFSPSRHAASGFFAVPTVRVWSPARFCLAALARTSYSRGNNENVVDVDEKNGDETRRVDPGAATPRTNSGRSDAQRGFSKTGLVNRATASLEIAKHRGPFERRAFQRVECYANAFARRDDTGKQPTDEYRPFRVLRRPVKTKIPLMEIEAVEKRCEGADRRRVRDKSYPLTR